MRLVFQFPASITSVVDAPRLVSSDASPTRPECAVTRLSTPAAWAAVVNRNPIICADSMAEASVIAAAARATGRPDPTKTLPGSRTRCATNAGGRREDFRLLVGLFARAVDALAPGGGASRGRPRRPRSARTRSTVACRSLATALGSRGRLVALRPPQASRWLRATPRSSRMRIR